MTKEQAIEVKVFVNEITGKNYKKTFAAKNETLHIRIGEFIDGNRESCKEWISEKEIEREYIIAELKKNFPKYTVLKNNKRYQGFINDICITVN